MICQGTTMYGNHQMFSNPVNKQQEGRKVALTTKAKKPSQYPMLDHRGDSTFTTQNQLFPLVNQQHCYFPYGGW